MDLKGLTHYPCFTIEVIEIFRSKPAYSAPPTSRTPDVSGPI